MNKSNRLSSFTMAAFALSCFFNVQATNFSTKYPYLTTCLPEGITPNGMFEYSLNGEEEIKLIKKDILKQTTQIFENPVRHYHQRNISKFTFGNIYFSIERTLDNGHKQILFYDAQRGQACTTSRKEGDIIQHLFLSDTLYVIVERDQTKEELRIKVFDLNNLNEWDDLIISAQEFRSIERISDGSFIIHKTDPTKKAYELLEIYKADKDLYPDNMGEALFINHLRSIRKYHHNHGLVISPSSHKRIEVTPFENEEFSDTFYLKFINHPNGISHSPNVEVSQSFFGIFSHDEQYASVKHFDHTLGKHIIRTYTFNSQGVSSLYHIVGKFVDNVTCFTISHDNKTLCCATNNGFIYAFDLKTGKEKGSYHINKHLYHDINVEQISFSAHDKHLFVKLKNQAYTLVFGK